MTRDIRLHLDPDILDRYVAGHLLDAEAASVEAHIMACQTCREHLAHRARTVPALRRRHDKSLSEVLATVDSPRLTLPERLLLGLSAPEHVVRLVAAAPALRQAWWVSGTALLLAAVLVAQFAEGTAATVAFVVIAPVVPLAGVALSYGLYGEPAGQLASVASYGSFRLALVRTAVVMASWLPVGLLLGAFLPGEWTVGALWLMPALALCCLTLALSTIVDPLLAASVLGAIWLATAGWSVRGPRNVPASQLLNQFLAYQTAGQLILGAVALAALMVTFARRSAFDTWSNP